MSIGDAYRFYDVALASVVPLAGCVVQSSFRRLAPIRPTDNADKAIIQFHTFHKLPQRCN